MMFFEHFIILLDMKTFPDVAIFMNTSYSFFGIENKPNLGVFLVSET